MSSPVPDTTASPTAPSTQPGRGRTGGRGGRGGRGNGGRGSSKPPGPAKKARFKGSFPEMGGHVFELPEESNDRTQFSNTMTKLKEIAQTTYVATYQEMATLFQEPMTEPKTIRPAPLEKDASEDDKIIRAEELRIYAKNAVALKANLTAMYAIIWGQTSPAMQTKIKSTTGYELHSATHDCVWLLTQIKSVTMNYDNKQYPMLSQAEALAKFYGCKQDEHETPEEYMNKLKAWSEVVKHCGGSTEGNWMNVSEEFGNKEIRQALAAGCMEAAVYVKGLDKTRYGAFIGELKNDFTKGIDNYPTDLATAFAMVNLYELPQNKQTKSQAPSPQQQQRSRTQNDTTRIEPTATVTPGSNYTFVQGGSTKTVLAGNDGRVFPDVLCYNCNCNGHFAGNCNEPNTRGVTLTQFEYVMTQSDPHKLDRTWILLDTQSTISVFNNEAYLKNIRPSTSKLVAVTNGGQQEHKLIGDFPNLGAVWYNPASIANILSLRDVRKVCRVTLDTNTELALHVHRLDGTVMKFVEEPCGLYVFKPATNDSTNVSDYSFVNVVDQNKKMFTKRQVDRADQARALYRIIGRPGESAFEDMLRHNRIHNCPITIDDARRSVIIYGPDIAKVKGTTTAPPQVAHVPNQTGLPVPRSILLYHSQVTLAVDFIFVNEIPFLTTISRDIGWRTIAPVPNKTKATMLKEIRRLQQIYLNRGLPITAIHGDNDFACLRDDLGPVRLDIAAPNTHVPEIERSNRTLKERARTVIHGLPYVYLPIKFVQHLMIHVVQCLNMFPARHGVSSDVSPDTIMTGSPPPDYNHLQLEFGTYVQVYDTTTNTPRSRTQGAIALGRTRQAYYFLSLASGHVITRHHPWTVCPISNAVLLRMQTLAELDKQKPLSTSGLLVDWDGALVDDPTPVPEQDQGATDTDPNVPYIDPNVPYTNTPEDPDILNGPLTDEDDEDPIVESLETYNHGHIGLTEEPVEAQHDDVQGADEVQGANHYAEQGADQDIAIAVDDQSVEDILENEDQEGINDFDIFAGNEQENEEEVPVIEEGANDTQDNPVVNEGARYNLRNRESIRPPTRLVEVMDEPHSTKTYETPTVLFQTVMEKAATSITAGEEQSTQGLQKVIFGRVFAQMNAKAAISLYGDDAVEALMKEFAQLDDLGVFLAKTSHELTWEQRKAALRAINLVTKKRDGRIKGRTVADGSVQRNLYEKSQTASPTVSTDALLLSLIVDAHEGRDVAVADVVGAYLKADMKEFTLLKFTGESVEIMCKMNPSYEEFVTDENGKRVLYVQLLKALYGCVVSALLWYQMFAGALKEMGFTLNPYDNCVANKSIEGKQCTIAWYVDDMKISHVNSMVVMEVIAEIEARFGKMSVTRGKKHKFLGMDIEMKDNKTVEIQMKEYLQESIDESGLEIKKDASTPARSSLFAIDEESEALTGEEYETFRSVVAKLLYVAIRARMDILLPVSFLCTRVTKSTKQDQRKLQRVLEYIRGTLDLKYTMGSDSLEKLQTWVDAAFAVHPDMKSHTGGVTSFGIGGVLCKSSKQKLNTRSSTEAELVGASDYLPNTLWIKLFMEAQGHKLSDIVFEQDNESAIKMETNGRMSAGQKSRHIDIRYFWIKERTESEGIKIRHCPTLMMLADFFTKPLNGSLFKKFRDVILGYKHVSSLREIPPLVVEERVGKSDVVRLPDGLNVALGKAKGDDAAKSKQRPTVSWADRVAGRKDAEAVHAKQSSLFRMNPVDE